MPDWYLRRGTIKAATVDRLEAASSSCERWGIGCAGIVVSGVIAEFVIAGIHPPYDSFLEQWGSAIADAIVAIGIVGEVAFGVWDSRIQTELRRRSNDKLSDAVARAAKLENEAAEARERTAKIEQLTAWRRLSAEHRKAIADAIRPMAGVLRVLIEFPNSDPEAFNFASELCEVFEGVVGPERVRGDTQLWMQHGVFGLVINAAPALSLVGVAEALSSAGIAFEIGDENPMHRPISTRNPLSNFHIFVAPKPPPTLGSAVEGTTASSANEAAATLREAASAAIERAAATQRQAAPRDLTAEQQTNLVEALKNLRPKPVTLTFGRIGDAEAYRFATQLLWVVQESGIYPSVKDAGLQNPPRYGLKVSPDLKPAFDEAEIIVDEVLSYHDPSIAYPTTIFVGLKPSPL